jgi:hypothetical protein
MILLIPHRAVDEKTRMQMEKYKAFEEIKETLPGLEVYGFLPK